MQQRIVLSGGKKYIVNVVGLDDVGPAADFGTLWMQSTDLKWYAINLIGTSGSIQLYVNQTPLTWESVGGQDFGYQLLYCYDDSRVYQTYLSGSAGDVTMSIAQSPWASNLDYKPYLFLKSLTDGYFYTVSAKSGSMALYANPNSKTWMDGGNPSPVPKGSLLFGNTGSYLSITSSEDWNIGTGSFTVEWFQYQTKQIALTFPRIFTILPWPQTQIGVSIEAGGAFYFWSGGTGTPGMLSATVTNYLNRWCHFAVCRSGSNLQIFKDGVSLATHANSADINGSPYSMSIGRDPGQYASTTGYVGHLSNFHFIKGVCLYTGSTYTVPTSPLNPISGTTNLLLLATNQSEYTRDSSLTNKTILNYNNLVTWSNASP